MKVGRISGEDRALVKQLDMRLQNLDASIKAGVASVRDLRNRKKVLYSARAGISSEPIKRRRRRRKSKPTE